MNEIKVNQDIYSALDALASSASTQPIGSSGSEVDFPDNDMPCFYNYSTCIVLLNKLYEQYIGLLVNDVSECKMAVSNLEDADIRVSRQIQML